MWGENILELLSVTACERVDHLGLHLYRLLLLLITWLLSNVAPFARSLLIWSCACYHDLVVIPWMHNWWGSMEQTHSCCFMCRNLFPPLAASTGSSIHKLQWTLMQMACWWTAGIFPALSFMSSYVFLEGLTRHWFVDLFIWNQGLAAPPPKGMNYGWIRRRHLVF